MLAQEDLTHAAGADRLKQLVSSDHEIAISAQEELLGLKRGEHAVANEASGQKFWIGREIVVVMKLLEIVAQTILSQQRTDAQMVKEIVAGGRNTHASLATVRPEWSSRSARRKLLTRSKRTTLGVAKV